MKHNIIRVKEGRMKLSVKWLLCAALFTLHASLFTSCSDMLETESTRQNIDPSIGDKTDSVFYSFGIMQAMQELADQYVFQGELRGDLVKTTYYTDNNLRELANFTATTTNKYDSAYVYYRVINNCNYYIAHCDTNQYNGSTNVIIDKYIAAKAIRAWAYLQLGRNYERVPFFTEPLTQISQISRNYPELTLTQLVDALAPDLEQYTGAKVPTLGYPSSKDQLSIGSPNWESTDKRFLPRLCFIPIDVVLGDMYLEAGNYAAAAKHFVTFFTEVAGTTYNTRSHYLAPMASKKINTGRIFGGDDDELPSPSSIAANLVSPTSWAEIFSRNSVNDIISYIPMAPSAQDGTTTLVPLTFGFDYYATPDEKTRSGAPYVDEIQLLPSDALNLLSDSTEYYYYASHTNQTDKFDSVRISKAGDMRLRSVIHQEISSDTAVQWIDKYKYATIVLYRSSTIWLRLAEAFNRLGMPDAAFAILKDGIGEFLLSKYADGTPYAPYLTEESRTQLKTTYPLLSEKNLELFPNMGACGIHTHGAGQAASDFPNTSSLTGGSSYHTGKSPYQFDRMVGLKMQELAGQFTLPDVATLSQDDSLKAVINAVEDLICDEMALELAFEGSRYYDLLRIARHKNVSSPAGYPANFGYEWMKKKLEGRGWDESKMYLPFK